MQKWTVEDSDELYNISGWGERYFSFNKEGNMTVTPKEGDTPIDLKKLVDELVQDDIASPMLLRFPDILGSRIKHMSDCFQIAGKEYRYQGENYIVYPIKVNQMKPVIREIARCGKDYNIGLEAGSKPELHAVIAMHTDSDSPIVCNGHKDEDYIELALLAQKMGKNIFLVVEKPKELHRILKISRQLKMVPQLGFRIKLSSSGSGKWEESGGIGSKFGLNASELINALEILKEQKMEASLQLIHFHIGSQITRISRVKAAIKEAAQFYVQLRTQGFSLQYIDIGGGLGVDYDGTKSPLNESSVNYSMQEFINDVISLIVDASDKGSVPHPNIITEWGRALTAHHSVLVFDVLETGSPPVWGKDEEITADDHELLRDINTLWKSLNVSQVMESWHDAQDIYEEALERFKLGILDLQTRGKIERLFWTIARDIYGMMKKMRHGPDELNTLSRLLSDKYFCNFSLFQSLPDSWAIDQVFPIVPLQNLHKRPERTATLQDITCDSDGKIDHFVSYRNILPHLAVHKVSENEPYYMGVFLVGAYQEILGDLHNLFGNTNVVHIRCDEDGYKISQVIDGETVADVLDYVEFEPKKMVRDVEKWAAVAKAKGTISSREAKMFLDIYRSGLYGYTYFE